MDFKLYRHQAVFVSTVALKVSADLKKKLYWWTTCSLEKRKVTCGLFYVCVSVQKGRVEQKTIYHLLLQLQNHLKSLFCKGHLTFFTRLFCKHWVGTQCYYVMLEVELVQDEQLWLKAYIFRRCFLWLIISLHKTLIPQIVWSPLKLHWNFNLDIQPVGRH